MRHAIAIALLIWSPAPPLLAQAPDLDPPPLPAEQPPGLEGATDPELQALEDEYAQSLIAVRRELGERYLLALKRLQDDLTTRQQIEEALLVKLERERVAELLDSAPELEAPTAGALPQATVVLDPARARCAGGTLYETTYRRIRNWTAAGSRAEWDLDADMPPGRYEVIVEYAAGSDAGGDFELVVGTAEAVRSSVSTNAASSWKTVTKMLAGTVPINADSRALSLTCVSLRQPYLWTVHSVTLAPPGTWEEMERARIEEALAGSTPQPAGSKLGELEALKGARLDPTAAATRADRFTITHGGQNLPIRLYAVTAPPAISAASSALWQAQSPAPAKIRMRGFTQCPIVRSFCVSWWLSGGAL